jgi:hypothetical protein
LSVEEYADIHAGDQVCGFGRGGLDRHCRTVNWVNNQCDGLSHLVEVDADVMSPGDSGGPWFRNNRAIGIHHGPCGRYDLFRAVGNLPRALEAVIMMDE